MKIAANVRSIAPKSLRPCFALDTSSATMLLDFSLFFLLSPSPFSSFLSLSLSVFLVYFFAKVPTANSNSNISPRLIENKSIMLN